MDIDPWHQIERNGGFAPQFLATVADRRKQALARKAREYSLRRAHEIMARRSVPERIREMILTMSAEAGVPPSEVLSGSRRAEVVALRNAITYRVKADKPMLSAPRIATWFCCDHTTVLHRLAAHALKFGLPKLTGYDIVAMREKNRKRRHRPFVAFQYGREG